MSVPASVKDVTVRLARADERRKWDALMFDHHYLKFIQFAGRGLRYVADYAGQWVALLGWQSGAFKSGAFVPATGGLVGARTSSSGA